MLLCLLKTGMRVGHGSVLLKTSTREAGTAEFPGLCSKICQHNTTNIIQSTLTNKFMKKN